MGGDGNGCGIGLLRVTSNKLVLYTCHSKASATQVELDGC